jgi:hypothetical protein
MREKRLRCRGEVLLVPEMELELEVSEGRCEMRMSERLSKVWFGGEVPREKETSKS